MTNTGPVGTPQFAEQVVQPANGPFGVACPDLNNDGWPDLVWCNDGTSDVIDDTVSFVLNRASNLGGLPQFSAATTVVVGPNPSDIAWGDLNADGLPDLVVALTNQDSIAVMLNTFNGSAVSFSTQTIRTGPGAYQVGIARLDNDTLPDIAVTSSLSSSVVVLRQTPGAPGTFLAPIEFEAGPNPLGLWQADFNNDGKIDLVATVRNVLAVLVNTGKGNGEINFASPVYYSAGDGPVEVVGADLDKDGHVDLACTNYFSGTVTVLINSGAAGVLSFKPSVAYATGTNPWGIDAGDFDGDGRVDLVAGNEYDGTASIFFNSPSVQPTAAPFVDDGLSGGAVFGIVLGITAGFVLLMLLIFALIRYAVKRRVPPVGDQPMGSVAPSAPPAAGPTGPTASTIDFD
jgi:hypothetical protein